MSETVTFTGNVGTDPETKTIKGKPVDHNYFDHDRCEWVDGVKLLPDRDFQTFSLALVQTDPESGEVEEGEPTWFKIADFDGHLAEIDIRTGQFIEVTGVFSKKAGKTKDGEPIVFLNLKLTEPPKILREAREQLAA